MKCEGCGRDRDSSEFKLREFHRINRCYYICKSCNRANRPSVTELSPKGRWEKKALAKAKEYRSKMLMSAAQIDLTVLVWGPGESGGNQVVFRKREDIRNALRRKSIEAYFSEELPLKDELGNQIPFDTAEVFQSEYASLVINLADSVSSLMEAQDFTKDLGDRCLLWVREGIVGYPKGLIDSLAMTGRSPLFFNDEDIKSCVVAKCSEDWVHSMRIRQTEVEVLQQRLDRLSLRNRRKLQ